MGTAGSSPCLALSSPERLSQPLAAPAALASAPGSVKVVSWLPVMAAKDLHSLAQHLSPKIQNNSMNKIARTTFFNALLTYRLFRVFFFPTKSHQGDLEARFPPGPNPLSGFNLFNRLRDALHLSRLASAVVGDSPPAQQCFLPGQGFP